MNATSTNPAKFEMSVKETLTLPIDMTALLEAGQSVTAESATLVNRQTKQAVSLAASPTVAGNIVSQQIAGPTELVSPGSFLLTVTFTASPSTNTWVTELEIDAVT